MAAKTPGARSVGAAKLAIHSVIGGHEKETLPDLHGATRVRVVFKAGSFLTNLDEPCPLILLQNPSLQSHLSFVTQVLAFFVCSSIQV